MQETTRYEAWKDSALPHYHTASQFINLAKNKMLKFTSMVH